MNAISAVVKVIGALQKTGAKKATQVLSPHETVKAVRWFPATRRANREYFTVTIGRPNYAERLLIAKAQRAGEPFPIKRVRLVFEAKKAKRGKR